MEKLNKIKVGIIDIIPNPSNGIIQGFNVGGQQCESDCPCSGLNCPCCNR